MSLCRQLSAHVRTSHPPHQHQLTEPGMMLHYLAYLVNCVPLGSLTFFSPTIVNGLGFDSVKAQLMTVPPWVLGYFFSLFLGWSADRHNARGLHIFASSILGAIGWITAGSLPADAYTKRYVMLFFCACGAFPSSGPLSAWVTCNVPAFTTLAIATAMNNSMAGVSQVIAQWIWRPSEELTGYPTGNYVCAGCSFATALIALVLRWHYGRMNRTGAKDARGKDRIWLL
jgi:hypothetical protein